MLCKQQQARLRTCVQCALLRYRHKAQFASFEPKYNRQKQQQDVQLDLKTIHAQIAASRTQIKMRQAPVQYFLHALERVQFDDALQVLQGMQEKLSLQDRMHLLKRLVSEMKNHRQSVTIKHAMQLQGLLDSLLSLQHEQLQGFLAVSFGLLMFILEGMNSEHILVLWKHVRQHQLPHHALQYNALLKYMSKHCLEIDYFAQHVSQCLDAQQFSPSTYSLLILAIIQQHEKELDVLQQILQAWLQRFKQSMPGDDERLMYCYAIVLNHFADTHHVQLCKNMFAQVEKPTEYLFSIVIKACAYCNDTEAAHFYFEKMQQIGFVPSSVTINTLLYMYTQAQDSAAFEQGLKLFHTCVSKFPFEPTEVTISILIRLFGELGDWNSMQKLFTSFKLNTKNCNAMIESLASPRFQSSNPHMNIVKNALVIVEQMRTSVAMRPDAQTLFLLLRICVMQKMDMEMAKRLYDELTAAPFCIVATDQTKRWLVKQLQRAQQNASQTVIVTTHKHVENTMVQSWLNELLK